MTSLPPSAHGEALAGKRFSGGSEVTHMKLLPLTHHLEVQWHSHKMVESEEADMDLVTRESRERVVEPLWEEVRGKLTGRESGEQQGKRGLNKGNIHHIFGLRERESHWNTDT